MGLRDWIPGMSSSSSPSPPNPSTPPSTPSSVDTSLHTPDPSSSQRSPTGNPPSPPIPPLKMAFTTSTPPQSPTRPITETLPPPPTPFTDSDPTMLDKLASGDAPESTDTKLRYAGYGARIRTLLSATHRYVAYTSDIGESFRPVAHPWLVRGAYGVSWAYILGDVGYEGYKAYLDNKADEEAKKSSSSSTTSTSTARTHQPVVTHIAAKALGEPSAFSHPRATPPPIPHHHSAFHGDYRIIAVQRLVFQSIASMALPAFTIHSIVRYSGRLLKNHRNVKIRTWGPVGLGLSVVPALPYLFDEPVEKGIEWAFEKGEELVKGGGKRTADKVAVEKEKGREL